MIKIFVVSVMLIFISFSSAFCLTVSPLPLVKLDKEGVATITAVDDNEYWRADIYKIMPDGSNSKMIVADDIIVAPKIFKAPKSIRIATKHKPDGDKELFYRIIITQQVKVDDNSGVRSKVSMSIPVVYFPNDKIKTYTCNNSKITNTGNIHIKAIIENKSPLYILPGQTQTITSNVFDAENNKILCPDQI